MTDSTVTLRIVCIRHAYYKTMFPSTLSAAWPIACSRPWEASFLCRLLPRTVTQPSVSQ